jgi:nitroimidazol reductase NimA-like FMN-containing flavoprotein (pyridoxamine 5'-phosphate oxidase superfamily)
MPRDYSPDQALPTDYQRRPEYARDEEWIRGFLRSAQVAHIASARDGRPFINPTTFWFDEQRQRIVFHSNLAGRVRDNLEHNPQVCIEVSELGRLLPSNVALEFSLQYRSVVVFGAARLLQEDEEKRLALSGLIGKYFPALQAGRDYRPIQDKELQRTSVYSVEIEAWSGKENWKDRADQSDEWPALDPQLLEG